MSKNNTHPWMEEAAQVSEELSVAVEKTTEDKTWLRDSPAIEAPPRNRRKAERRKPADSDDKAQVVAMYRHWKKVHEASGRILANLEEIAPSLKRH